jgi:TPR repeat protein
MEEWKAKERAKLHDAANKPKIMQQDNAFPSFAGDQKDGDRAGSRQGKSTRGSEDSARPSTSNGRGHQGSRSGGSRNDSRDQMSPPPAVNGRSHQQSYPDRAPQAYTSSTEQQPMNGYPPPNGQRNVDQGYGQPPQSHRQYDAQPPPGDSRSRHQQPMRSDVPHQTYDESAVPRKKLPPQVQPIDTHKAQTRKPIGGTAQIAPPQPPPVSAPAAEPRPTNTEPEPTPAADTEEYFPQESWRTGPPRKRPQGQPTSKPEPSLPSNPRLPDPAQPQHDERAVAPHPQATAPPVSQQRTPQPVAPPAAPPVTRQMPERKFSSAERLPQVVAPRSHDQVYGQPHGQPHAQTYAQTQTFARPHVVPVAAPPLDEQLDDFYDDYYSSEPHAPVAVPAHPQNREQEIESEMPDFDSAAPGQTSILHKRVQTVDKHLAGAPVNVDSAPPMPAFHTQQANHSVQSLPVQRNQPYGYQQEVAVASQPELRDARHDQGGASHGFVFGVPGEESQPQQQWDDPQQLPPSQQPMAMAMDRRPAQSVPPENTQRFQPPVDQRQMQMPMRGGPPGEQARFYPPGQGPLPPQQRSASARPPMAQPMWSDPGQRAPTAPPMRLDSRGAPMPIPMRQDSRGPPMAGPMGHDPRGPPPPGMPRTGSQMNQQHRAPSAPPGQQAMRGMPPPGAPRNGPPFNQQQGGRPPLQEPRRSDPDALPHHPVPFRPGLMEQQGAPQPPKPAPVRNYDGRSSTSSHTRQVSVSEGPITKADLEQARLDHEASKASPRLALRYAKKLVEASHVLASEGGRLDAKTTQRNREKYLNDAYKRVKDLVRNAYPEAQFYMAECYGTGELGLEVDAKEAFQLYQAAAKGGHAAASFRTAVSCEIGPEEGGGTRRDYPKAVQWYRRAAALGDVAAMFKLGIILLRGLLGVPRNVGEAVTWLKRAAERADIDNPHALHELATLHEPTNNDPAIREKVLPDEPYALSLFKQAADFGFRRSQFRLGQAYEYGSLGLDIDNRASIAWYTKAAAQGEHQAELALSGWYLTGAEGILEQSDMEAYLWARKAAQSEPPLAKAMFAMGYFTEQGIGCPKSLEEAKRWYGRAACKCFSCLCFLLLLVFLANRSFPLLAFQFPRALERLEELRKGNKNKSMQNGKLTRDKKKDDENCAVM